MIGYILKQIGYQSFESEKYLNHHLNKKSYLSVFITLSTKRKDLFPETPVLGLLPTSASVVQTFATHEEKNTPLIRLNSLCLSGTFLIIRQM